MVELAKFPVIYTDQLDVSKDGVYITTPMNGEWRPHLDNQMDKARNAHLILWNLERPSGSAGSIGQYSKDNRELQHKRYIDEIWHSDRRLAQETDQRFVILGSDERLAVSGPNEKQFAFCHMSYETGRRQSIYKHFPKDVIGQNCWEPERSDVLRKSRFALNVHQDNHPFQEPLRFALFAAYALPILSETIYDNYPFNSETMENANYDDLVRRMNEMLGDNYSHWQQVGLKAKELLCKEFGFKKMIEQAINESVGWR